MYRLISRLVIYRGMEEDGILLRLSDICQRFYSGDYDKDNLVTEIYEQIHSLLDLATRYGFNKNLWQCAKSNKCTEWDHPPGDAGRVSRHYGKQWFR